MFEEIFLISVTALMLIGLPLILIIDAATSYSDGRSGLAEIGLMCCFFAASVYGFYWLIT